MFPIRITGTDADHLILQTGRHTCACGEKASRLMRCAKCRTIIAKCGACGDGKIERLALEHCR